MVSQRMENGRHGIFLFLLIVFFSCSAAAADGPVRYADLGDFPLENGKIIRDCRVAYLTSGTLNADKSNILLVSTWLAGTPQELVEMGFVGPGKIFDSSKFYVIAVESFGGGGSSSPSNSPSQPGPSFPGFTIRDIVRAQHAVLTGTLDIHHIRAVAGISMGAMATFQWMASYPDFMDQAIPILGGIRMSSAEMLFWSAELAILENITECKGSAAAMKALAPLHVLHAWTPDYLSAKTSAAAFPAFLNTQQEHLSKYDALNWAGQVKAILAHDILKDFGGSSEAAAAAIRAKCLLVTSPQDQMVHIEDAKAFARLIGAETAQLNGACGHFAFLCDRENLKSIVQAFLSRKAVSSPAAPPAGRK
ncbi:MAG: alpha/beta fold hydrolase [Deltaproteobacteria bacterium]|nr:alpha/beta fold hydrolase [Deltaproteobacteria bacterium]